MSGAAPVTENSRQRPRTCVACREESPRRALIRVVRSPSGEAVIDERNKLPGRGAYLCANLGCVEKAKKTKALSRALKGEVRADIYDRLTEYISSYGAGEREKSAAVKELALLLGLARRAGVLYIGVDSVKLHSGEELLLILTAKGCSESVRREADKIAGGGKHVYAEAPVEISELSQAIGANGAQAVALPDKSGLADKIKMLIFGQRQSFLCPEGRTALEQNESV